MMKNPIAAALSIATLAVAGGAYAASGVTPAVRSVTPAQDERPRPPRDPFLGRMGQELGLTEAQQAQIKTITEAERASVEPAMQRSREIGEQLRQATASGQFDEAQVRLLAAQQATQQIELTVSRAREQAKIYQVLTAEQRAKLDEFAARRPRGPGGRGGFGGPGEPPPGF